MPTAAKPKAKAKASKTAAQKAAAKKTAAKPASKPAAKAPATKPQEIDGHTPPAPGPEQDNAPSADPPEIELAGQREDLADTSARLIQDKTALEPEVAVGGAELAGAQIAQQERDPMTATGVATSDE